MKIKEVIVVEGKNDAQKLKSYFACDTIETQGTHLSKRVLRTLQELQATRGIIVFCDPDAPGERIRCKINECIPNAKNAFIMKEQARTSKKVGVEHASKEALTQALSHLLTYQEDPLHTMDIETLYALGLQGQAHSAALRTYVGERLHIGKCNAKTLLKRINMLQLDKTQIEKVIEDYYE